ncbi:stromelysin-1-like [Temnothorax curvispinosus]|uniref:Stromelysin-1-like n=1 Tax=Temnothorax curvispinosus TaxID=300111 RepID=A0A6J1QHK4_9HYME|nr:stromelysin-1-like [Temnothorax curvispinosus]
MWLARVIALTACFITARCITPTDENYAHTIDYLQKYGYLTEDVDAFPAQRRNDVLRNAIDEFQQYYGLPGDGTLDNQTLQLMLNRDVHSALTFERSETNPDIIISFRTLRHGNTNVDVNGPNCSAKFDSPGNVLAHAHFLTDVAGFVSEIHVDGDKPWHIHVGKHPADKFSLHYTLTHEIGHSLGLAHNKRRTSVMFAFTPDKQYPVKLDKSDILDVQRLYGEKVINEPPRTPALPPPLPPPMLDLCTIDRVNGILILENRMYISYRRYVWSIDLDGRTYNGPLALSNHMCFLHDNYTRVTAAYQSLSGDLMVGRSFVVFNGNSVGEINECNKRVGIFTAFEATFPRIPTGVTLIFRYVDDNLYFTTRTQFYRFNEFTKTVTAAGKFDLWLLNIVCPKTELLQQLRDLLDQIVRVGDLTSLASYSDDDDDSGVQLSDRRTNRRI